MKRSFILLCLLACILNQGNAQGHEPDAPVLLNVSIDPVSGAPSFNWIPSDSVNVTGYTIYRQLEGPHDWTPSPLIWGKDTSNYTWEGNWGLMQSWPFVIAAWDTINGAISEHSEPPHISIFLEVNMDPCEGSIDLLWNNYSGWGDSLLNYIIFKDNNPIDTLFTLDTSYSDLAINPNTFYRYHIKATHSAGRFSTSNSDTLTTSFDSPPDYINALGTVMSDDIFVDILFEIGPSSELSKYYLLRSENPIDEYDPIQRLDIYDSGPIILSDTIPEQKPYYYKLVSMNHCLQIAMSSNIASTISLSTTNNNLINSLEWNEYLNWATGVLGYEVYRQIDEKPPVSIALLTGEITSYIDYVEGVALIGNSGNYCYYIEARGKNEPEYSKSNKSCVHAEPMIYMPNAFTPDGDGLNDIFWPVLTFLPDKYIFIIKNRWGNTLFETHDPYAAWDGTFSGGPVPEGVYVYYVRAISPEGKLIERMGQVAVLYN